MHQKPSYLVYNIHKMFISKNFTCTKTFLKQRNTNLRLCVHTDTRFDQSLHNHELIVFASQHQGRFAGSLQEGMSTGPWSALTQFVQGKNISSLRYCWCSHDSKRYLILDYRKKSVTSRNRLVFRLLDPLVRLEEQIETIDLTNV